MFVFKYVAGKVAASMPNTVEFEDLVGFGVFGLLDAIEKFDPDKNVKFKTYAITRIRGAIFDELRSIDWVPRSVRQKTKEIEDAVVSLESKLGRSASDQEIAEAVRPLHERVASLESENAALRARLLTSGEMS